MLADSRPPPGREDELAQPVEDRDRRTPWPTTGAQRPLMWWLRFMPGTTVAPTYQFPPPPLCRHMTDSPDAVLTAALLLGWRVAELYALVDDTGSPAGDTLLPAHESLEPADQLELQLRAASGDARRAGVTSKGASMEDLVDAARAAAASPAAAEAFRARLRRCHIEVQKDLWALDEALGKAYELGNGLSDTYGRVCRVVPLRRDRHARDVAGRLPPRPRRAAQEAARRPAVAAERERRRGRARPARRVVRGRRRAAARGRAPPESACARACGGRP